MKSFSWPLKWVGIFTLLIATDTSFAATFTVKRVRGKQAVIEYSGKTLVTGENYVIGETTDQTSGESRKNFLGIRDLLLSSVSQSISSATTKTTRLRIAMVYGWNWGHFEAGPLAGFTSTDAGSGTSTTFLFGAVADYNFQKNDLDQNSIWGFGGEVSYEKGNSASGNTSPATTHLFTGPFWKWFLLGSTTALRFDLGFDYSKTSESIDATSTGVVFQGGISSYF